MQVSLTLFSKSVSLAVPCATTRSMAGMKWVQNDLEHRQISEEGKLVPSQTREEQEGRGGVRFFQGLSLAVCGVLIVGRPLVEAKAQRTIWKAELMAVLVAHGSSH